MFEGTNLNILLRKLTFDPPPMMKFKQSLFLSLFVLISYQISAQQNFGGQNYLGITGGMTTYDIQTGDLVTKPGSGFAGGFTTRGAFFNDFDLVYGLSFQNSKLKVEGRESQFSKAEDIGYTVQGVNINFFGSYNIIVSHLSVEFGPVFGINGKMNLDDKEMEDYLLSGYNTTTAKDIQDISKFDFRLAGGLTAGFEHFRFNAQYQYGLTNALGKLNDQNLENTNFKGNSSTIFLGAVIYF